MAPLLRNDYTWTQREKVWKTYGYGMRAHVMSTYETKTYTLPLLIKIAKNGF
jgi:hypothetical protein